MREKGQKVGYVNLRWFRPFPTIELREPPTSKPSRDGFLPVELSAGGGGSARTLAVGFYVTTDGGTTWTPRYVPLASEDERYGQVPLAAGGSAPFWLWSATRPGRS